MATTPWAFGLLRLAYVEWKRDKAKRLAAAIAYYGLFALAPLVLVALAALGLIYEEEFLRQSVIQQFQNITHLSNTEVIEGILQQTADSTATLQTLVLGIAIAVLGASGFMFQMKDAVNTIWKIGPEQKTSRLKTLQDRAYAFAVIFPILILLGLFIVINTLLNSVEWASLMRLVVSTVFMVLVFACLFKFLPNTGVPWKSAWLGAGVSTLFFIPGTYAFSAYVTRSSFTSAYGAAGSLVVLLVWMYFASTIFLFGVEMTKVASVMPQRTSTIS